MLEMVSLDPLADRYPRDLKRRPAAARRPRPGLDQPADPAAPRRAARRAGLQPAPADDGRAQDDPARARHHLHHSDAFSAGGDVPRRQGRGDERRGHPADRDFTRGLRGAAPPASSPTSSATTTSSRGRSGLGADPSSSSSRTATSSTPEPRMAMTAISATVAPPTSRSAPISCTRAPAPTWRTRSRRAMSRPSSWAPSRRTCSSSLPGCMSTWSKHRSVSDHAYEIGERETISWPAEAAVLLLD